MSAFDCVCKVASLYYQHLVPYMDALFSLTTNSVGREEQIAIRAIEFWNVICEVECAIQTRQIEMPSMNYVGKAIGILIPLVTSCMTKQVRVTHTHRTPRHRWLLPLLV